jgi:hypothetical protein
MKLKTVVGVTLTLLMITVIPTLVSIGIPLPARSNYVRMSQGESTIWDKDITQNTTWYLADSPYIIVKDIKVYTVALLTIEPGVVVKFADGTELYIAGGLSVQGNITHPITFTSNFTTPVPGIWDGVIFDGIKEFLLDYILIEYASTGVKLISAANISNSVISNCTVGVEGKLSYAVNLTVTDNSADGLSLSSSPPIEMRITKSVISNNGRNGITVIGNSTIDMDDCVVSNNVGNGVFLSNGGYIKNSRVIGNSLNGTCILGPTTIDNTTISANGGDGIWAESGVSIAKCNITGNEGNGIKSNYVEEATTIEDSAISANGGDGIWMGSSMSITRCNITENAGNGTSGHLVVHGFSFSITNCTVFNNTQNGVTVPSDGTLEYIDMYIDKSFITNNSMTGLSGRGYVFNSTVSGNKMCGILGNFTVELYNVIAWNQGGGFNGTGVIYWSSIFDNTPFDVVADVWPNNVTATHNWWGTNESALIREHIWDWNDTSELGCVFYGDWLSGWPQPIDAHPPKIVSINWTRTSPPPYSKTALFPKPRINEPVCVSVNVTDDESPIPSGVDKVLLWYRVDGGEWWTTKMTLTMMYNATSGNWTTIIPPQPGNSTVEFFIQAYDKAGNSNTSSIYTYDVKWLQPGDINGDGIVDIEDIYTVALNYGKIAP